MSIQRRSRGNIADCWQQNEAQALDLRQYFTWLKTLTMFKIQHHNITVPFKHLTSTSKLYLYQKKLECYQESSWPLFWCCWTELLVLSGNTTAVAVLSAVIHADPQLSRLSSTESLRPERFDRDAVKSNIHSSVCFTMHVKSGFWQNLCFTPQYSLVAVFLITLSSEKWSDSNGQRSA